MTGESVLVWSMASLLGDWVSNKKELSMISMTINTSVHAERINEVANAYFTPTSNYPPDSPSLL